MDFCPASGKGKTTSVDFRLTRRLSCTGHYATTLQRGARHEIPVLGLCRRKDSPRDAAERAGRDFGRIDGLLRRAAETRPAHCGLAASPGGNGNHGRVRGGKVSTTDGPFAETKEQLGGYLLIDVRDLNDAVRIASKFPAAQYGSIEVRPLKENGCA
ncbi:MAG: YciI family protein [Nitrospiraceae bacterium]